MSKFESRRYMLDTNIVSDMLRNPAGKVAARICEVGADAICISIVTAAELRFGAARRASARLSGLVEELLNELDIIPLAIPVDAHYADIRNDLEKSGRLIGPNDLLIAAHARALGAVLVTANTREFSRVTGLHLQNWVS